MAKTESQAPKVGWAEAAHLTREYVKAGFNICFVGPPGVGKTALITTVTKQLGYDLVIFHPVISDPTDFKGFPVWWVDDKTGERKATFVAFGELELLINATKPTVCFFDDLLTAPDAVQASLMQIIHGGTINGKKISKHVRFVACTNRKSDRAGGTAILEPVKGRFHGIFELVPEIEPLIAYLIKEKASPILVAFLRNRPEWATGGPGGWKPIADIAKTACARSIEHLSDVINLGLDKAMRPAAYQAAVGPGMANEYFSFECLAARLPDVNVILTDPNNAPRPASDETAYAILGVLHNRMTRRNIDNIYTYIRRCFSLELQAVFHFDVSAYDEKLMQTKSYVEWSREHGEILSN